MERALGKGFLERGTGVSDETSPSMAGPGEERSGRRAQPTQKL